MTNIIRARVVKIGNSQGIRIPKLLLEQASLGEEVELEVGQEQIVIRPVQRPRHDWDEAFQMMAGQGDDELLDADLLVPGAWDEEEWEW